MEQKDKASRGNKEEKITKGRKARSYGSLRFMLHTTKILDHRATGHDQRPNER